MMSLILFPQHRFLTARLIGSEKGNSYSLTIKEVVVVVVAAVVVLPRLPTVQEKNAYWCFVN